MKAGFGELAVLVLWTIAGVVTALAVEGSGAFLYIAPVLFVCMVGNIVVLRKVREAAAARD